MPLKGVFNLFCCNSLAVVAESFLYVVVCDHSWLAVSISTSWHPLLVSVVLYSCLGGTEHKTSADSGGMRWCCSISVARKWKECKNSVGVSTLVKRLPPCASLPSCGSSSRTVSVTFDYGLGGKEQQHNNHISSRWLKSSKGRFCCGARSSDCCWLIKGLHNTVESSARIDSVQAASLTGVPPLLPGRRWYLMCTRGEYARPLCFYINM